MFLSHLIADITFDVMMVWAQVLSPPKETFQSAIYFGMSVLSYAVFFVGGPYEMKLSMHTLSVLSIFEKPCSTSWLFHDFFIQKQYVAHTSEYIIDF